MRRSRHPPAVISAVLGAAALAGCAPVLAPASFAGRTPEMRPERFFAGATVSQGVMEDAAGAPLQRFTVTGRGEVLPDGALRLDQTLAFEGQPTRTRTWTIRSTGAHAYATTLTDAAGPFASEAYGDLFHLRYRLKGVPTGSVEQWLYLQADGRTVVNELVAKVAGVTVRRVSERISRAPPPR